MPILWYITLVNTSKLISLGLAFAGIGVLLGVVTIRVSAAGKPTAGLKVETDPPSLVFVNNVQVGQTPLDKMFPPGDVTVKLVPESTSSVLSSYQTQIKLTDKIYTVIRRNFGATDDQSSGEIISLVPQTDKTASLSITTSVPDTASVTVDNQPQGFTPLTVSSVSPTDHQIEISSPGYGDISLTAKAVNGYKLSVIAQLAAGAVSVTPAIPPALIGVTPTATPSAAVKPTPPPGKPTVSIASTPTGSLRVRQRPDINSSEIGRVNPGDSYPLLGSRTGWYEISGSFQATTSGWISSQYAKKSP